MAHNQRRHCGPIQAAAHKRQYAEQRNRTETNRANRLRNRLRINPKDLQLLESMRRRNISP